jgi:predicted metal-dependent phosphotriesterase family hydrolase
VAMVETARGPVQAAEIGRTLMHEHVFVLTADVQQNFPDEWGDEDARVADAVQRLGELPRHGVDTTGLTLGMDRFGIDHFATFEERSEIDAMLVRNPARIRAGAAGAAD